MKLVAHLLTYIIGNKTEYHYYRGVTMALWI
jgi:hypothetical protein